MAGNVAEMVNDWLKSYPDTLSIDPVGPIYDENKISEDTLERPIRGGTFDLGMDLLQSSGRRGAYPTPAVLSEKFIGFRCALGAFFPSIYNASTVTADTSGVLTCNLSDLIGFMGISGIKCVFVKEIQGTGRSITSISPKSENPCMNCLLPAAP